LLRPVSSSIRGCETPPIALSEFKMFNGQAAGNRKLAIIGLGYVGLPLAVEFGKKRPVVGFDINHKRVADLQSGKDHTLEVAPDELRLATQLQYTSDLAALSSCDVFIVTVPTPIDKANRPDLTPLVKASATVGKALKKGAIVVYESTVYPGCTEEVCVPVLEKTSGLKYNVDFFCGYSPERIVPGDKVNTLTKIRKITSGSTLEIADLVDGLYNSIITAGTHKAASIKVAEAAKVIENTQRDLNIALVNELSVIFERLGIDTLDVLEAAGSKWNFLPFRPGMVGGHCIGVDPYYLTHKAEEVGYHPQVILAGRRINDNMARYVARNTIKLMLKNGLDVPRCRIGVMGITFKENCPDIRNSKVVDMVREFQAWGAQVVVTDAWASADEVAHEYGLHLARVDAANPVDALVVAVGHTEYRQCTIADLRAFCRGDKPVLADVKSLYDRRLAAQAGFTVFRL
jgi:UDP-N-acetyl-D-glucosamine/UDP-N-acetyl-D-galactosamine dehydrogenase